MRAQSMFEGDRPSVADGRKRAPKREAVMPLNIRISELEHSGENPEELAQLRQRRAEIMARRRTEYNRAKVPLFADQVPESRPESFLADDEGRRQAWVDMRRRHAESARNRRAEIAAAVSPEQLAAMDERWRTFKGPHDETYEATYWLMRYREVFKRNPPDVGYVDLATKQYVYGAPWPQPGSEAWGLNPKLLDDEKNQKRSLHR